MTHGFTYLPQVDHIVVLSDGRVSEEGSYEDLLQKNGAFADLLKTYFNDENQNDSDDKFTSSSECEHRFHSV